MRTRVALDVVHRIDNKIGEFAPTKTGYTQEERQKIKAEYLKRIADKKLGSCNLTTQDSKFNHRFYQTDIDLLKESINKIAISEDTALSRLQQMQQLDPKVKITCKYYAVAYILDEKSRGAEIHSRKQKFLEEMGREFTQKKFSGNSFYKDVKKYYESGDYEDISFLDIHFPSWRTIFPTLSTDTSRVKNYIQENY